MEIEYREALRNIATEAPELCIAAFNFSRMENTPEKADLFVALVRIANDASRLPGASDDLALVCDSIKTCFNAIARLHRVSTSRTADDFLDLMWQEALPRAATGDPLFAYPGKTAAIRFWVKGVLDGPDLNVALRVCEYHAAVERKVAGMTAELIRKGIMK